MSLYRDSEHRAIVETYKFYGIGKAFATKIGRNITPESAKISPSIEKVSYASFFTKDINGDMIPADAKTDIKNLYYGTCSSAVNPRQDGYKGFINKDNERFGKFHFYTLDCLDFMTAIPNGNYSEFSTLDEVAVGENGRLDKVTDSKIQTALPLMIYETERQLTMSNGNNNIGVLVLKYQK
jgi:hypothetical protein